MEQLIRIYNTLGMISTKGDDTVLMAQCLVTLKQYIEEQDSNVQKEEQ